MTFLPGPIPLGVHTYRNRQVAVTREGQAHTLLLFLLLAAVAGSEAGSGPAHEPAS